LREKVKHIILFVLTTLSFHAVAQDIQFTQFSSNPIFLNPAYTGATYEHRFILNYRNQWPGISKTYSTFAASYDYNMTDIKSGVGIQLIRDKAGSSALSTTGVLGSYAYYYQVEKFKLIRMGLQLGYMSRYYDYGNLVFNDQLYSGSAVSNDIQITPRVNYLVINAGALYTTQVMWAGFALHNINKPNTSLVDGSNKLPMKFSVHGGYRFILEKKGNFLIKYFAPGINYRHQHKFDQLDIGANFFYAPLSIGIWYRGIPVKHYLPGYPNTDAVSVLLGIDIKQYDLRIAFSYDMTLSRLASRSLGAPELSIIYEIAKKSKRKRAYVSCPKF
jgi:type IX secretion system PorP/SprF family membrane protein